MDNMSWKVRHLFVKAQTELEENRLDGADRLYTEIIEKDPKSMEAVLHRAYLRMRMNRFDEALVDISKFTTARPENGVGFLIQGEILLQKKEYMRAYEVLKKACLLEKDNGRAYFQWGLACLELGRKEEAADYFEHSMQFERDYVFSQWMLRSLGNAS
jgi:tetratricopeptide (TPR) repeat protein